MSSYRFKRRSFLTAVGGAFGLSAILRNLEAGAQGTPSPPRLLVLFWPGGTIAQRFIPSSPTPKTFGSPILKPFDDAGLTPGMSALYGFDYPFSSYGAELPHMRGAALSVTGIEPLGATTTDVYAAGPSFDQILLKRVPELGTTLKRSVSVVCDARAELTPISYGYETRSVQLSSAARADSSAPLAAFYRPIQLYQSLFAGFMPGGNTDANQQEALRAIQRRKSVLDSSLRELSRLRTLAPSSELAKLDAHAEAIRRAEQSLGQSMMPTSACTLPSSPDAALGEPGASVLSQQEAARAAKIGEAHMNLLVAALACDLTRVATFQWGSLADELGFAGMYPGDPSTVYGPSAAGAGISDPAVLDGGTPPPGPDRDIYEFLSNVSVWYNTRTAELLRLLKVNDVFGAELLGQTIVPIVTDLVNAGARYPAQVPVGQDGQTLYGQAALIAGGAALGMKGGQFLDFRAAPRNHNDLWMTIAQAYFGKVNPLPALEDDAFDKEGVAPIQGLWAPG
jgi:hypothetical protein